LYHERFVSARWEENAKVWPFTGGEPGQAPAARVVLCAHELGARRKLLRQGREPSCQLGRQSAAGGATVCGRRAGPAVAYSAGRQQAKEHERGPQQQPTASATGDGMR
jgi:hypothetical protein